MKKSTVSILFSYLFLFSLKSLDIFGALLHFRHMLKMYSELGGEIYGLLWWLWLWRLRLRRRLRVWQWLCFNHRIIHFINHHRLCLLGRIWRLLIIRNNDEQLHFHQFFYQKLAFHFIMKKQCPHNGHCFQMCL